MACQLNRISRPPTVSIAPLTGTASAAAGTPFACAYPVIPLAFVKWLTPAFTKNAAKPMRPTQATMVQRSTAAVRWEEGLMGRWRIDAEAGGGAQAVSGAGRRCG